MPERPSGGAEVDNVGDRQPYDAQEGCPEAIHPPDRDEAGHVAIVRPSAKNRALIDSEGPDVIQAGRINYGKTTLKRAFKLSNKVRKLKRIRYYSHSIRS